MATTKVNVGRQTVLAAKREFVLGDLTEGVATPLIYLKPGTRILRGFLDITEAFDSTSTDTIDVGDTETPDPDRYTANPISVHATGLTALTAPVADGVISTAEAITVTWESGGGSPTAGAGLLYVEYIEDARVTELHPVRA